MNAAQADLVAQNVRLVPWALKRYHPPPGWDEDDMHQIGLIGLMHAAEKYDPTRGFTFATFATKCIRVEILDALRHQNAQRRGGSGNRDVLALATDASIDALAEVGREPATPDDADTVTDEAYVEDVLRRAADLDARLPLMLRMRMDGYPMRLIGEQFGVTEARVSQIVATARTLVEAA